ncbi:MAG: hypothetical protein K6E85_14225 [Lachnospiraceae bacterium]|nr:hypothetical protein [Lachnospiraceae bacterium]
MSIETVKFRGRHVPKAGLTVLITGSISVIVLIALCIISAVRGGVSELAGAVAMAAAVSSILGLIMSVVSAYERDIYMAVPIAGMIVNGISFTLYAIVFILGIV